MNSRNIPMGEYISSHIRKKHRKGAICKDFCKNVLGRHTAYTECGKYFAIRLPLTNKVLKLRYLNLLIQEQE